MINDKEMPTTIIRESWADRQAKFSAGPIERAEIVNPDRVRPPVKERNHSVKHRAIR